MPMPQKQEKFYKFLFFWRISVYKQKSACYLKGNSKKGVINMHKLKIGFLGLGQRGNGLLGNILHNFPDVEITAVCDSYPDRTEAAAKRVEEARGTAPAAYDH